MNKYIASSALALGSLLLAFTTTPQDAAAAPAAMVAQQQGTWSAPDNQTGEENTQVVASNAAGTTDKVLVLTPTGPDKTFSVEVFDVESGDVLDTVEYSDDNTPPVVVPPGAKARVKDDQDSDKRGPKGTSTFV